MFDQDEMLQQVRDALNHLYDYPYLESHPLALRYKPEVARGGPSRAHQFNRLLLESIEALNPPGEGAADTSQARFYSLLVYRYVEERPLPAILRELGYSRSRFFREQQKAITMLASMLSERLSQQARLSGESNDLLDSEAERLLAQHEAVDPAEVVHGVLEVVKHLSAQRDVSLALELAAGLPPFYGSRTLLRQVLLKALSGLISQPGARRICIHIDCRGQRLVIELVTELDLPGGRGAIDHEAEMEPVRHLVEMMGGQWQGIEAKPGVCTCRFDFPVNGNRVVLVIEDNEAMIRVFQSYLADYGYMVIGVTSGSEALKLAREVGPVAITVDIMMPGQDGWEILQTLKSDPATQSTPVIICSVLEDPELARSLGASAYLQKPISQAKLLGTLNRLSGIS